MFAYHLFCLLLCHKKMIKKTKNKSFQSETVKFDEVKEQVIEEEYNKKAEQKLFNVEDFEEGKVKEGQDEMNIKVAEKKSFPLRQ